MPIGFCRIPLMSTPFPACRIVTVPGCSAVESSAMLLLGTNIHGSIPAPGWLKC